MSRHPFSVVMKDRSGNFRDLSTFHFGPPSYTWNSIGGPEELTLPLLGNSMEFWSAAPRMLRNKIWLYDWRAKPVWWGYVNAIKATVGGYSLRVELDSMSNRIMAVYPLLNDGTGGAGEYAETIWDQDDNSYTEFGAKEEILSLAESSAADAAAAVAEVLERKKVPQPAADLSGSQELTTDLVCSGWWRTLTWMYYENPSTAYATIAEQAEAIFDQAGQFFYDFDFVADANFLSSSYRDLEHLAIDDFLDLIDKGTDDGRRLLPTVTTDLRLIVKAQPEKLATHALDRNLKLYDAGGFIIPPQECTIGVWVRLSDLPTLPDSAVVLSSPSPVFIERATYRADDGSYQPEASGFSNPYMSLVEIQR